MHINDRKTIVLFIWRTCPWKILCWYVVLLHVLTMACNPNTGGTAPSTTVCSAWPFHQGDLLASKIGKKHHFAQTCFAHQLLLFLSTEAEIRCDFVPRSSGYGAKVGLLSDGRHDRARIRTWNGPSPKQWKVCAAFFRPRLSTRPISTLSASCPSFSASKRSGPANPKRRRSYKSGSV